MIAGILLVGIIAVTLTGCKHTDSSKKETEKPVITLGSDNYPPYNYLNEDGVPTGIDVELAAEAFKRMGYQVDVVQINWEKKKELVESGEIDCIMGCFSMEGRLDDYRWAGPYIASRQVVAVNENSDIYKLSDLEGKNLAVQSTTKPEGIFLNRTDENSKAGQSDQPGAHGADLHVSWERICRCSCSTRGISCPVYEGL